jgi:integrase
MFSALVRNLVLAVKQFAARQLIIESESRARPAEKENMRRPELTEEMRRLLRKLEQEQDGDTSPTIGEVHDLWWKLDGQHLTSGSRYEYSWRDIEHVVGSDGVEFRNRRVMSITGSVVEELRDHVRHMVTKFGGPPAPATRNQYMAIVRRLVNFAVEQRMIEYSPLRVKLEPVDNVRQTAIRNEADFQRLCGASDMHSKALALLMYDSGMRRGESVSLARGQIERDSEGNCVATLYKTKRRKARTVPITQRTMAALEALPKRGDFFFSRPDGKAPYTTSHLYRKFKLSIARSGIKPPAGQDSIWCHDLRHSCALIRTVVDKWPGKMVMSLLGHSSETMLRRYGVLNALDVCEAMKMVERRIEKEGAHRAGPKRADGSAEGAPSGVQLTQTTKSS